MQIMIKGNYIDQATANARTNSFEDLRLPFEKIVNQYLTPKRMIVYKLFYLLPAFVRGKLVKLLGVSSYD